MSATKVLFIGNSYTYCNDLPKLFEKVACAAGDEVESSSVTSGGKTLEWHWYNYEALEAIEKNCWDVIVFQEQSLRPVEESEMMRASVARFAKRLEKISARPMLYMTWARQHLPEMQAKLAETYHNIGKEFNFAVAPVGIAWQKAFAAMPELVLHTEDHSHPNFLGSYLAACVFYGAIFRKSPEGLTNEIEVLPGLKQVIAPELAAKLRKAAAEALNS